MARSANRDPEISQGRFQKNVGTRTAREGSQRSRRNMVEVRGSADARERESYSSAPARYENSEPNWHGAAST